MPHTYMSTKQLFYCVLRMPKDDAYFVNQASGRSYSRYALGVRYELNDSATLKLETNRTRQPDTTDGDYNEAWFQYAIRF